MPALADQFPFYGLLWPLYLFGNGAVQVFWVISGFVFAKVYAGQRTPGRDFALRRFARLYPLHFVTLLIVALLQLAATALVGSNLIYQYNDPYHFALQLAFASNWGLESGFSFNGPIWSVSVEVLVYFLFWLVAEHLLKRGILGPLAMVAGAGVMLKRGWARSNSGNASSTSSSAARFTGSPDTMPARCAILPSWWRWLRRGLRPS